MGEEKKDILERLADESLNMVKGYKAMADDYACMKAQMDMLKRFVMKDEYASREKIIRLMGWDENGEY